MPFKAKTFKEAAEVMGTSTTTVMRRFKEVAAKEVVAGVKLPKAIAISGSSVAPYDEGQVHPLAEQDALNMTKMIRSLAGLSTYVKIN